MKGLEINAERGEITFHVQRRFPLTKAEREQQPGETFKTEDKAYTLKLSMNAARQTEARTKRTIGDLLRRAQELEFEAINQIFWSLCQKYHGEEIKTLDQAGELLDDCGGGVGFFEALNALNEINQAPASLTTAAAQGQTADPQTAQPGAGGPGEPSSLPLDA